MLIYDGLHYDALALEADGLLEAVRISATLHQHTRATCRHLGDLVLAKMPTVP